MSCSCKCVGSTSSKGSKGNPGADGTDGVNGLFGGFSSNWIYDSSTANNPSTTQLRLNNADPSLATAIYINAQNAQGASLTGFLATITNGGVFGYVRLFDELDPSIFFYYHVTNLGLVGAVTTLAVTYIGGNQPIVIGNSMVLSFTPTGATGAIGNNAFKFKKDFTSVGDGDVLTISYAELTVSHAIPAGDGATANPFIDLQVAVWILSSGSWIDFTYTTGVSISINNATGLISVTLAFAPFGSPLPVRIVVLA